MRAGESTNERDEPVGMAACAVRPGRRDHGSAVRVCARLREGVSGGRP